MRFTRSFLAFIFVMSIAFLSSASSAFAYEEPWDQVEAKTKLKANRRVDYKRIKSTNMKYSVPFKVILPSDYDSNPARRYGVVLMLCGASGARRGAGAEPLYFSVWCKLPRVMDNLVRGDLTKKDFEHMITDAELATMNEKLKQNPFEDFITVDMWHPSASRSTNFDRFIVDELFPFLDANYRTLAHRDFRAIDGACGGSAVGFHIALRNPSAFGACGGMQTDVGSYPGIFQCVKDNAEKVKASPMRINLNTNRNDVCNSYEFRTVKNPDGTKKKVPDGELARFTTMLEEEAGCSVEVTVFRHCIHGYSAYRYPNGHQSMYFYSSFFKEKRPLHPELAYPAAPAGRPQDADKKSTAEVDLPPAKKTNE